MKHINSASFSMFFKKISLLSFLLLVLNFSYGQCDVPFAKGDIDSTFRNVPVATPVTHNDITYYGSGVPLTGDSLSIYQTPQHGTLMILNDSVIEYIPNPGFVGTDFYIYTVCNSCGNCAQASVSINVKPYCPPPMAVADYYTVYNNVPGTLNVTSNDTNIALGPLTLGILHNPQHGSTTVSGSQIIYTGTAGYVGPDTFVYLEYDTCPAGHNVDSAFVYLNVITCQPVVAVNDTFNVQQLSAVSANVAANDTNVNGFGNVTVTLLNGPKFGSTATLTGTTINYTAGSNGYGTDAVEYMICTDCGCDSAYAVFNVTEKPCSMPIAVPDSEYAGYSINCTSIFPILVNDTIPINGGTLSVTLAGTPLFGTASIVNGDLHYTCTDSTKVGQTDVVYYSICNTCFCDTSFVTIKITSYPCNGLNPVINNDTVSVCRNHAVVVDVTANDYSPQGLTVSVQTITAQGAHGTAAIVNANDIQYTPNANFAGTDHFTYWACDNGTPSLCNLATVTIHVDSCNAAPIILGAAGNPTDTLHISVYEDSSKIYCFNYIQVDSPEVTISYIGPSPDTIVANSLTPGTHPCITITPPTGSRAEQIDTVIICNGTPTCTTVIVYISIIPVNHPPIAKNDTVLYNWSTPCTGVNVIAKDITIDSGDHITLTSFTTVTANGGHIAQEGDSVLCYTADSSFAGVDIVEYTICNTNNLCDSAYVIVIVPIQARNDEAVTKEDSAININVTANDTRTSNEYISLCSQPQHGTVAIDSNNVLYTPAANYPVDPLSSDSNTFIGADSFCYTLCSVTAGDTICANAEVYVTVLPEARFYIPQGISPNGDGVNDVFVIASVNEFPNSQLLVYNRYGDEVWRNDGNGYLNNFDGTWKKNGQPLPDGSYWYIFKFNDGTHPDRMGYIIIQR